MQTAQSNHSSPATSPLLSHPREEDFTHLYQNGNNQDEDENALLASTLMYEFLKKNFYALFYFIIILFVHVCLFE